MRESTLETRCKKFAKAHGWSFRKQGGRGHRGKFDDYFFKAPGRIVFVEFKAPGKEPSKRQLREQRILRDAGFRAEVVDNFADFERALAD